MRNPADAASSVAVDLESESPTGAATGPGPQRIADYEIVRQIGEGGMGAVYLARQDEPVRRDVALKLLRAGTNSADVVARFAVERQALASMEHPNITHVFDAGLTPEGQPYFVMELVNGLSLDAFASRGRLSTRDRVRLFVQVCRAVQHAHQKGIIHRDLKPSNVMVVDAEDGPLCKVIDFGIAKATAELARTARITATGMSLGTPAYMSPEQFLDSPSDVDTRSDIYSLGVVLYELLTGVLPGDSTGGVSWASLMRRAHGDFPSASAQFAALDAATREAYAAERATDPATLRRLLHGDLDCILLKALDPDRERRYASAAALAHDLEQYLADRPVEARSLSATYRMSKFARRHRAGVILGGVLLVVLVVTAVGATVQARRLAAARSVAVSRQREAEQLVGFMLGDISTKLRPIGRLEVLDDVARRALAYFTSVPAGSLSDAEVFQRADALRQLGELRLEQGRFAAAGSLMRQSIELVRPLVVRDSLNPRWQLLLAHAQYGAGSVAWRQGNVSEAAEHFVPFASLSEQLVARYPDSLSYRAQRAYALNNIGFAAEGTGDTEGALRSYLAAQGILAALVARDSTNDEWRVALGSVLNATGVAQRKLGALDASLATHTSELAERLRHQSRDPDDATRQRYVAIAHVYTGDIHLWRGEIRNAVRHFKAARAINASLVAKDPANASWRVGLGSTHRRLAEAGVEDGNQDGALRAIQAGRATLAATAGVGQNERALRELSSLDELEARVHLLAGRALRAATLAQQAAERADSVISHRPADLERRRQAIAGWLTTGEARHRAGQSAPALAAGARALSLVDASVGAARETELLAYRARALALTGRADDARSVLNELQHRKVALPSVVALRTITR